MWRSFFLAGEPPRLLSALLVFLSSSRSSVSRSAVAFRCFDITSTCCILRFIRYATSSTTPFVEPPKLQASQSREAHYVGAIDFKSFSLRPCAQTTQSLPTIR
jgi:hypothetical protein